MRKAIPGMRMVHLSIFGVTSTPASSAAPGAMNQRLMRGGRRIRLPLPLLCKQAGDAAIPEPEPAPNDGGECDREQGVEPASAGPHVGGDSAAEISGEQNRAED